LFLDFFELREQPFGVTPDPRYLYWASSHREALASLYYGINTGCGFMALIAAPGMGKTTILVHLLGQLRGMARTAYIFQTQCGARDFLRYLLADLDNDGKEMDIVALNQRLNAIILEEAGRGRRLVLVIDEAQNLKDSVLETVRLLSDFETPHKKLLQIVMAGQPALAQKLAAPNLEQLRQRISIVGRLSPLSAEEVADYVRHRLLMAGHEGEPLFSPEALNLIAADSGGIPRRVNILCFNALTLGYAQGQKEIQVDTVEEVIADLDLDTLAPPHPIYSPEMRRNIALYGMNKW
jgi:general secretion pathway protein A